MLRLGAPLALVTALGSSGCLHVQSDVPGVLDLRSDGADAPLVAATAPASEATRSGVLSFLSGTGVEGTTDVRIEDRNTYFVIWGPVFNASSTEEWRAAMGNAALKNVVIGDEYSYANMVNQGVRQAVCSPITGFVAFSLDFKARATRVAVDGAPALRAAPTVPPPDASTPATTTTTTTTPALDPAAPLPPEKP